ncbi:hypothetical protein ERJ75_000568500 [Trypanosoma vivax]|nr:hypothetical protein ERJ75_000568500 [Trypanosoma vivax]
MAPRTAGDALVTASCASAPRRSNRSQRSDSHAWGGKEGGGSSDLSLTRRRARSWHGARGAARPGGRRYKRSWRGHACARVTVLARRGGTEHLRARDTARAGGHVAREPRCARGTGTAGRTGRMRHATLAAAARVTRSMRHMGTSHRVRAVDRPTVGEASGELACRKEKEGDMKVTARALCLLGVCLSCSLCTQLGEAAAGGTAGDFRAACELFRVLGMALEEGRRMGNATSKALDWLRGEVAKRRGD